METDSRHIYPSINIMYWGYEQSLKLKSTRKSNFYFYKVLFERMKIYIDL